MYLDIVSNYDLARFGTNLGVQFGSRPLVFFAPMAVSGHLMGAFGHGSIAFHERSYCVDGGARFSGVSSGFKWSFSVIC